MKKFLGTLAAVLTLSFAGASLGAENNDELRECRVKCRKDSAKCRKGGKDQTGCKKDRHSCYKVCRDKHAPKR
ncbi:MAG: hypothetical protein HYY84_12285 [Deltaproteobacteria bacterium]|nr:hypothetical protein [Deltaproteobacteria bacterium]